MCTAEQAEKNWLRYSGMSMNEQTTIDIYRNACAQIASQLESYGFHYFKSEPKLKRVSGDLTYEISFSTSMYNSKGNNIAIDAHALVKSKKLKKWRSGQPQCKNMNGEVSDRVAISAIRYFPENRINSVWNLANPLTREAVIDEIVGVIINSALPFFKKFEIPELVARELIINRAEGLGMSNPKDFIEYSICFLSDEIAKEIVISYLEGIAKLTRVFDGLEDFIDAYRSYSEMDLLHAHRPNGHANEVAYYSIKYDWGNLSKGIS